MQINQIFSSVPLFGFIFLFSIIDKNLKIKII